MRITKVTVDFVFASNSEFACRVEWTDYRKTVRVADGPIYGKILPSGSAQLYEIDGGAIRKFGNGVVKADVLNYDGAVYQEDLMGAAV